LWIIDNFKKGKSGAVKITVPIFLVFLDEYYVFMGVRNYESKSDMNLRRQYNGGEAMDSAGCDISGMCNCWWCVSRNMFRVFGWTGFYGLWVRSESIP
jgi:hypothetical protein